MLVMMTAVLWDFGGVILTSPFEAFRRYEIERGLPIDHIRTVNSTNPHSNAWALLERNDIAHDEFDTMFAAESEALGHRVPGADVLSLARRRCPARDGGDARSREGCRLPNRMPHQQRDRRRRTRRGR